MSARAEQTTGPEQPLAANLCWLLSRASHVLTTELTAALERLRISPRGYHVLASAACEQHTQIEIARLVGLDKTTMVVTLDELEAAGLARRRPSDSDRRTRVVEVTAKGRRTIREADRIMLGIQADVLAALPAEHREAVLDALGSLVGGRLAEAVPCAAPVRQRVPRAHRSG